MQINSKGIKVAAAMLFSGSVAPALAQAVPADFPAPVIVDASINVGPYTSVLENNGVKVVGRYFARCTQPDVDVPEKRLIDNAGEIEALKKSKLNMLSIYQFYSGASKYGDAIHFQRPRKDKPETIEDFQDCIPQERPENDTHPLTIEGQLDGYAAAKQAEIIGQPKHSAIYFGVDFDYDPTKQAALEQNVIDYFAAVKIELEKKKYRVGVYGNGKALELVLGKYADYGWLNASPAHMNADTVYNFKKWDMIQTKTDIVWGLSVDVDVQNPKSGYIGFWNWSDKDRGLYTLPQEDNQKIQKNVRFICDGNALLTDDNGQPPQDLICSAQRLNLKGETIYGGCDPIVVRVGKESRVKTVDTVNRACFGSAVRVLDDGEDGFHHVDCNWDDKPDGKIAKKNLSPSRPRYDGSKSEIRNTRCTSPHVLPPGAQ